MNRVARMKKQRQKKIWIGLVVALVLGVSTLTIGYRLIQKPYWEMRSMATRTALAETEMTRAETVSEYTGAGYYKIVTGYDTDNKKMLVFIGDEQIDAVYIEGFTAEEAQSRSRTLDQRDNMEILRVVPGEFQGQWIWEVFSKDTSTGRYYYDYYRLSDGQLLDSYQLQSR